MQRNGFSFLNFKLPEISPDEAKMSFSQRWREHVKKKRGDGRSTRCLKIGMRALMLFQLPSQLYITLKYITPYLFEDIKDEWLQYYFCVFVWFVGLNGITNWLCVILYGTAVPKSRDRPCIPVENQWDNPPDKFVPLIQETAQQNGSVIYDISLKEALPWEYCDKCKIHIPPRAHHCAYCKTCILKRDHHCFMVGNCIGFRNQRYFVMMCFHTMIAGLLGGYLTYKFVRDIYWVNYAESWTDLVFPIAIYRCILGSTQVVHCILVMHLFIEPFFGFIGFVYFTSQMLFSMEGKTLYEMSKKIPVKNSNSICKNLRSVFGDFWALNFFFPMTIIFRQREDGMSWEGIKYDHNANRKTKEDEDNAI
ncbi:hypothetical protein CHS0354_018092 [Potamilus streckersoni]|uniref:Palmitoyltransferase n=1 Tax=Potamilus streckersoni TaxID=2493646 RepID=A0AAE0TJT6_9BIVA|nr:hypothetical protein CHS0354_018092 [Potamilus streckersoni]